MRRVYFDFIIEDAGGAEEGDKVVVSVVYWGDRDLNKKPRGKVIEILGKAGGKEVEELAIFKQFDLPIEFPVEVEEEVEKIDPEIPGEEIDKRTDLRNLLTITIDPPTAKDYDDAISLEKVDPGREHLHKQDITSINTAETKKTLYKLYVHIADVSHYVPVDNVVFQEAVNRGNSFYFPRHVIPMLPPKLSNKVCSLRPDEDKLAVTVVTEFSEDTEIVRQYGYKSIIRSSYRLNYDEVDEFYKGNNKAVPPEAANLLQSLASISDKLSRQRYEKGYIPFNMPELEVELDDEGEIAGLKRSEETPSHKLVENCMLLANEYIAKLLNKHTAEGMYRVHEEPDEEAFIKMIELLHHYNIASDNQVFGETTTQKTVQSLLEAMPTNDHHRVFDFFILRSMQKAHYDIKPLGHFGLAMFNYTHFTSPIRRICDLTVHHLLKMFVWKETVNTDPLNPKELKLIAERGSERELLADSAERESEKLYKKLYMKDKIGETYTGLVVNLSKTKITIELDEIPILGYIPLANLGDDYYRFYSFYMELIGRKTGKVIRLLDRAIVRVDGIDDDVSFSLVKMKPASRQANAVIPG